MVGVQLLRDLTSIVIVCCNNQHLNSSKWFIINITYINFILTWQISHSNVNIWNLHYPQYTNVMMCWWRCMGICNIPQFTILYCRISNILHPLKCVILSCLFKWFTSCKLWKFCTTLCLWIVLDNTKIIL